MSLHVDVPVAVVFTSDPKNITVKPISLCWNGRVYQIVKVGFHHTFRQGKTLYHVFSVASQNAFFRLVLNTDSLLWRLEEVADDQ